jgi:hypothetical protein
MESPESDQSPPLTIGDLVRLNGSPAFLKTADPMPMLRPPDLVDTGEIGQVTGLRALDQLTVRFRRGTFLLRADQLISAEAEHPRG